MPPKRTASAGSKPRGSSAGGGARTGSARKKRKGGGEGGPQAPPPPPTMEEIIANVDIPKPYVGVLSDRGGAIYSIAVAEGIVNQNTADGSAAAAASSSASSTANANRMVFTGSFNGVITVTHCAPRPTVTSSGNTSTNNNNTNNSNFSTNHYQNNDANMYGGSDGNGADYFGGGGGGGGFTAFGSASSPTAGGNGGAGFDSTVAAAAGGFGSTRLLPAEDTPSSLFVTRTQTLPAHKNIIKQLLVVDDLASVVGKSTLASSPSAATNASIILPPPPPSEEGHANAAAAPSPASNDATATTTASHQVLLSCSTDGTIKLWSLPDCTLKAIYTTRAAEAAAAKARADAARGPVMLVDRARAALGEGVSKTTTFLTGVPQELQEEQQRLHEERERLREAAEAEADGESGGLGRTAGSLGSGGGMMSNNATLSGTSAAGMMGGGSPSGSPLSGGKVPSSTLNAMCLGPEGSNRLYAVDDEGYVHAWEIVPTTVITDHNSTASGEPTPKVMGGASNNNNSSGNNNSTNGNTTTTALTVLPLVSLRVHRGRATAVAVPALDKLLFPEGPHPNMPEPPNAARCVVTVSDEGLGKLINLETRTVSAIYVCESAGGAQSTEPAVSVAYRHPHVIIGCIDGSIQVFDSFSAERVAKWQGHSDAVNRLVVTKPFFVGSTTAVPVQPVYKPPTKKQLEKLKVQGKAPPPPPKKLEHQPLPCEAHLLVSCSDDRSIALWDCNSWTPMFYFSTPSASLSRFKRPTSAKFQSSSAAAADGMGSPSSSPFSPSPADGTSYERTNFNYQGYASASAAASAAANSNGGSRSAAPIHHKHSISDVVIDNKMLSELAQNLLANTNATNTALTTIAIPSAGKGGGMMLSSNGPSPAGSLTPALGGTGGGGLLLSVCFGGKILMWDYYSIVGALDQRERVRFNEAAVAKAKARAEAIAEKNKQNRR